MITSKKLESKSFLVDGGPLSVLVTVFIAVSLAGCSSMKTPPDTTSASFFQNPDRVWAAIEMSLDTLGYEIESSNRTDGKMRAVPIDDGEGLLVVLEIDQVAWSSDQVKVYIKPVAGASEPSATQGELDKVAADFLTILKRKLGG